MPTALAWPMSSKRYNWAFEADPEPALNNRVISCPRGKCLGGSSSINGMVYVRGHRSTFDEWHELGATGWDYKSILPYFIKAENWNGRDPCPYRGKNGPLHVKFGDNAAGTDLYSLFERAGAEAGYGTTEDYNAHRQEGFGKMAMTVFHDGPKKGMRCSTSSAYLHPTLKSHGDLLHVKTNVTTKKIIFHRKKKNGTASDNPKAVGVQYVHDDNLGTVHEIFAQKEVILCAGAIQSPQLLQVSGIGDRNHLTAIGLKGDEIIVDNPFVGQNLQDHLELYFQQEVSHGSLAPVVSSYWEQFKIGLRWILYRDGLGATNQFESAAFVRSSPTKTFPDVQFHFLPVGISYDGVSLAPSDTGHSMQVRVLLN
jgi:choline dehydrogenase